MRLVADFASSTIRSSASTRRRSTSGSTREMLAGPWLLEFRAVVALYWLRVEVLWVDEAARGRGIGSRLLAEAEHLAREMGARNAALETFEWQAPRFYKKHGYEEVARIEGYANGFYLALMKKAL